MYAILVSKTQDELIKNFLNIYWLRPETAIWRSIDAIKLNKIPIVKPVLDMGCGDGTFSFTMLGGKLSQEFDIFQGILTTLGFFKGTDIYNKKKPIKSKILKSPKLTIDVGLDHKQNLLDQASNLKLYKKLVQHDLNKHLPFDDNFFNTIFSNVFYWIDDIEHLLLETKRILKKNGKLIILVPDISLKKNFLFEMFSKKHYWVKALDRGIHSNVKHSKSFDEWNKLFKNNGFSIDSHYNYLSKNLIHFHNIGMRPYSPYIIEMANELNSKKRIDIKNRLVREIFPIIKSYIDYDLESNAGCFHLFSLKKA